MVIALAVLLGNIGLPLPEETTLATICYAAALGELHFPTVLIVGVISALVGGNIGLVDGQVQRPESLSTSAMSSALLGSTKMRLVSRFAFGKANEWFF